MLIRSQNKRKIVNLNNIDSIIIGSDNCIYCYNGGEGSEVLLGEYSSAEEAIFVLDMIQVAYETQNIFQMPQANESYSAFR